MDWLYDKSAVMQEISGGIPETEASDESGKYQRLQERAWSILPVTANGIPAALKGGEGRKALSKLDKAIFLVNGSKKKGANLLDYVKGVVKEGAVLAESMDYERAWENAGEKGKEYFGRGKCFTGDTLIYTEQGYVPIVEIQEGDLVWSMEEETGETGLKRVEAVFCTRATTIYEIEIEGSERISTTAYHPFYVACQGWVDAIRLRIGDILITAEGMAEITGIRKCRCDDAVKTYNFHVEDWTSYFVTKQKVYVHNPVGEHEELFEQMHHGVTQTVFQNGSPLFAGASISIPIDYVWNVADKADKLINGGMKLAAAIAAVLFTKQETPMLNRGEAEAFEKSKKLELENLHMQQAENTIEDILKLKEPSVAEIRNTFKKNGISVDRFSDKEIWDMAKLIKNSEGQSESKRRENKGKGKTKDGNAKSGKSRAPETGEPGSVYEQVDNKGNVMSRTKYGKNRRPEYREDLTGKPHYDKETGKYLNKHRHTFRYNDKGQPIGEKVQPIPE